MKIELPTAEQIKKLDPNDHITRDLKKELRRMAQASLYFFARYVFGSTGLNERAHKPLCDFAQDVIVTPNGFGVAEDPRGTGKSHAITIPGPAWCLIQDPDECVKKGWLPLGPSTNIMVASYKKPFAMIFVDDTRRRIEEQAMFQWLFGDLVPEGQSTPWSKEFFTINRPSGSGYSVIAIGTESSSTSLHPRVLFIDDLINEINWKSAVEVAAQVEWISHSENLVDIMQGSRIVTQNEWTERGVNAHLREKNKQNPNAVRFFSRSRIVCDTCENGRPIDKYGNPVPDGEGFEHPNPVRPILDTFTAPPFDPYTLDDVRSLRSKLPSVIWWSQHENNPLAKAELKWRTSWLRWYTIETSPETGDHRVACLLSGFGGMNGASRKPKDEDRYVFVDFRSMDVIVSLDPGLNHPGIAATGRAKVPAFGEMLFILDCKTGKMTPRDQFFLMFDWALKWGARKLVFERVGLTGYIHDQIPALAEAYMRERGRTLPYWVRKPNPDAKRIVGVSVNVREGDKATRIEGGLGPFAEQRLIACRRDITDFISEYEMFDKGRFMDALDAVCMTIKAWDRKKITTVEERVNVMSQAIKQKDEFIKANRGAIGYGEF